MSDHTCEHSGVTFTTKDKDTTKYEYEWININQFTKRLRINNGDLYYYYSNGLNAGSLCFVPDAPERKVSCHDKGCDHSFELKKCVNCDAVSESHQQSEDAPITPELPKVEWNDYNFILNEMKILQDRIEYLEKQSANLYIINRDINEVNQKRIEKLEQCDKHQKLCDAVVEGWQQHEKRFDKLESRAVVYGEKGTIYEIENICRELSHLNKIIRDAAFKDNFSTPINPKFINNPASFNNHVEKPDDK